MSGEGSAGTGRLKTGSRRVRVNLDRSDYFIVAVFSVFSALYFYDVFRGDSPYVHLKADASSLASFAAALDHPELFVGDAILDDPRHFDYYPTIHVSAMRWLAPIFGDYGTAFLSLLPIHVFVQTLGFYVLGWILFSSRYWAVLLAILNLAPIRLGFGTYWGPDIEPLARFTFQALLPFLLALAFHWRHTPKRWVWIMVGAGLMTYAHAVSAPAWTFALWLSLAFALPKLLCRPRHLLYLVLIGVVCLAISAPAVIALVDADEPGGQSYTDEVDKIRQDDRRRVEFQDIGKGILRCLRFFNKYELLFWAIASSGAAFLACSRPRERQRLAMLSNWACGIVLIAVVLPLIEQEVCRARGIPTTGHLLILLRNLRYLVPLGFIACLWPLAVIDRSHGQRPVRRAATRVAGILIVGFWLLGHPPLRLGWAQNWHDEFLYDRETRAARLEALDAVRHHTPPQSLLLAESLGHELRYYALRPVTWALHDRHWFEHTDPSAFLRWNRMWKEIELIRRLGSPAERLAAWLRLGDRVDADFLLLKQESVPGRSADQIAPRWHEVWRNDSQVLIKALRTPGSR